MKTTAKTFVVIDANALLHRSFHALPPLATKKGQLVNAVYGFLTVLFKVLKEFKPAYVAAAFDKKKKTFRHEEYAEYKAGRVAAPDEFYAQIPIAKQALGALHVRVFEKDGFEADDIIGTLAADNEKRGLKTVIVTGDKDTFQLISDKTTVYTLRKGVSDTITYDIKAFAERYGLAPEQMVDLKAIAGDPSDNIPGVRGIGEKGAIDLLKKFGGLENIYRKMEAPSGKTPVPPRYQKLLREHKKDALMSKRLATIVRNVPLEYTIEQCTLGGYNEQEVVDLFRELQFKSLLTRLPGSPAAMTEMKTDARPGTVQGEKAPTPTHEGVTYTLVDSDDAFADFLGEARTHNAFAVDTESTSVDPFRAKLLGISFCWEDGKAFYLNVHAHSHWLKTLTPLLEDPKIEKFGHNIKYDMALLAQSGITVAPVAFDSMVASYLLNPGSRGHGLDNCAFEVFGYRMQPITDLIGKGKQAISMELVPVEKISWYSCEDADYTYRLCRYFKPELEEKNLLPLMQKIEMPLVPVLAALEQNGVKIDSKYLQAMSREIGAALASLEKKIYDTAGTTFNINSPLQLKGVLFEKLGVSTEGIHKTKTGISTAAAELEKLKDKHPLVPLIIENRELAKLQSTYLEALPKLVNPKTGRVHTSFNQTVTATGRLSSSEPNLQNIPIRTEIGKKIRNAFIAEKGFSIVSADYSQIELRIVASLAGDVKMIKAFQDGEDIHRRTAADIYGIPLAEVTDTQRYEAKEVNFGVLYGMGAWGLASRKNMTRERARAFIEKYFYAHPEIQEYLAQTISLAHEQEYVETLFGRRRYLPEINSSMPQVRASAERMAVNMPVQGTAADLMKIAMINIHRKLPQVCPKAKMILQVHDELVFEVPDADVGRVGTFVAEEMDTVHKLRAPIRTDVSVGKSWGEMKDLPVS
ncbi:MAG: DNA polymerase I [Patescibacteria group bacterium]|nr:DNA polymerase I [Patescibacteria group bacterium]MDD5715881.1 DNA polymerase I [Patescibacteria group bacterium]